MRKVTGSPLLTLTRLPFGSTVSPWIEMLIVVPEGLGSVGCPDEDVAGEALGVLAEGELLLSTELLCVLSSEQAPRVRRAAARTAVMTGGVRMRFLFEVVAAG